MFTPGPWRYHEDGAAPGYRVIFGPTGSGRWKGDAAMLPLEIARTKRIESEEVDANWRLMSQAPELLGAAKAAADFLAPLRANASDSLSRLHDRLSAAIAAATKESR